MKRIFSSFVLLFIIASSAWPHLNSVSYSKIQIEGKEVKIELQYTLRCVLELFKADADNDQKLSEEELETIQPLVFYYLNNKIKILTGGRQLRMVIQKMRFVVEDDSFVVIDLSFPSKKPLGPVTILCNISEETDAYHRNLSQIKMAGKEYLFVFTNENYFDSANPPKERNDAEADIKSATPSINTQ